MPSHARPATVLLVDPDYLSRAGVHAFLSTWFAFTVAPQPAATPSGAIPTGVVNADFSGTPQQQNTVPGWTGTASFNGSYLPSVQSLTSTTFALNYPSNGSVAWFRIGYRLPAGAGLTVSFAGTQVFASSGSDPTNTWLEKDFSVPASAGASGQLSLTGTSPYPDVAYVQRLDGPSAQGTPRLGVTTGSQFPQPAAATGPGGIDMASGAFESVSTDLSLPGLSGALPLSFSRAYNSQMVSDTIAAGTLSAGRLGPKWSDNWQYSLWSVNPSQSVTLLAPGGAAFTFNYDATSGVYVGPTGVNATLAQSGSTWTLTVWPEDLTYTFTVPSGGSVASLSSVKDRNGNTTSLTYDGSNRLTKITDAGGRFISLAYDSSNRINQVSDSANRSVGYGYDPTTGDLTSVTDVMAGTTQYQYGGHWLTQGTDQRGNTFLTNSYDQQNRVTAQQDADGDQSTIAYATPSAGVTTFTDPRGKATKVYFDVGLRVTDVVDPLGNDTTTTYGGDNTVASVAGPLQANVAYAYNSNDDLTQTTDAQNNVWTATYDNLSDLLSVKDPLGHTRKWGYNSSGNVTSASDALSETTSYAVNTKGQITESIDARKQALTYSYSTAGDLTSVGGALSMTYTYDSAGHLTQMTDATGTTTVTPNAAGQITSVTFPGSKSVSYTYDADGNWTSVTYPGGSNQATSVYDKRGRLTSVTDWNGQQTSYSYDADGNVTGITLPASTGVTTALQYDDAGHLTSVTHSKGGTTLAAASYTLDARGRRTQKVDGSGTTTYTYDNLNRLTNVAYPGNTSVAYTYDAVGNRLTMVNSNGTTTYTYNAADELTSGPSTNTFDADGNQTARGADTFTWDAASRTTASKVGGTNYSMTYNGHNKRLSRTAGGTTTNFVWDIAAGLPTVIDDGTQYVYGHGLISHATASGTFYYLADGLGSTVDLVDSNGTVVQTYAYDAFGAVTASYGSQGTEYQFAGQDTDPSGLQHLRARYYDPSTGRFLNRDPLGGSLRNPQSLNAYAYAADDPVDLADPSGAQYYYGFGYYDYCYYCYSYAYYDPYASYGYYGGFYDASYSPYYSYGYYPTYDACGGGILGLVCGLVPQNQVQICGDIGFIAAGIGALVSGGAGPLP